MPRTHDQAPPHPQIGTGAAALRLCFNADAVVPRLVFLVSPTCEVCVSGAQSAAQAVLSLASGDDFRLYILWLPVLENDSCQAAEGVRSALPTDSRMVHFWDRDLIVSRAYHQVLQLGQRQRRHRVAWDIFLLYRAGTVWRERPPVPTFWMHQLFLDDVPKLEVDTLKCQLEQMIHADESRQSE